MNDPPVTAAQWSDREPNYFSPTGSGPGRTVIRWRQAEGLFYTHVSRLSVKEPSALIPSSDPNSFNYIAQIFGDGVYILIAASRKINQDDLVFR